MASEVEVGTLLVALHWCLDSHKAGMEGRVKDYNNFDLQVEVAEVAGFELGYVEVPWRTGKKIGGSLRTYWRKGLTEAHCKVGAGVTSCLTVAGTLGWDEK